MAAPRLDESLIFAAGRVSLDFVNTSCMRLGEPLELLSDREDLDRWLAQAQREYAARPGEWQSASAESLLHALELRAVLHELVEAKRNGLPYSGDSVEALNAVLRAYPTYAELAAGGTEVVHRSVTPTDPWLGEIARDAAVFLAEGDPNLLRQCECATCVRVFYDTTKNHKRRWCVEKCGSRVKSANYYRRKRAAQTAS